MESILIIEDSMVAQAQLQDILDATFRIRLTEDGAAGIAAALEEPPALILLDVNLPGMDGYHVCRHLKAGDRTKDIPVLFLTSLDKVGEKVRGFEAGADDYIVKPFYPAELLARINLHLSSRRQRATAVELERLNLLREMSITLNHELNNPMTTAFGLLYLATRELGPEQETLRGFLNGVHVELHKIREIVERLSAASRSATTEYVLGEKMIDLNKV